MKQRKQREDERASEENAATRKEKRGKHGRKQELRKNIRHKNAIAKKTPPPPESATGWWGRVAGGGSFVFSAQENYFLPPSLAGQLLPNCIYSQF